MIFKSGEELIMAMSITSIWHHNLCMYSYYNYFNIGYIILHKVMK